MDATPLLRMTGISKSFGAVQALVGVDFQVDRHEIVALVGDNAAGKSTLARIIAGVYEPDAGTIRLDGVPVSLPRPAAAQAKGIATVFQGLALADNLDVTANIFLGREIKVNGLLAEERMEQMARDYLHRLNARIPNPRTPVSELSGGQRQCVAIARTLVGDPQLVILDEPTASLSVAQTAEVLNHIQSLRTLGLGVVMISHSLTDVRAVSDRIVVLRHGRVNGEFSAPHDAYEEIIAAITGATTVRR